VGSEPFGKFSTLLLFSMGYKSVDLTVVGQFGFAQSRFSIAFRGIIEPCQRTEVARKTSIIRRIKATVAITSIVMPWRFVNPHFIAAAV
jgi:hypothetical protein